MMTGMSEDREDIAPVLTVTPEARTTVLEVLANEAESDTLALWLEVSGETDGAYTYDMYFQALADAGNGDVVQPDDGPSRGGPVVQRGAPPGRHRSTSSPTPRARVAWSSSTRTPRRRRHSPASARSPRSTCPTPSPSGW